MVQSDQTILVLATSVLLSQTEPLSSQQESLLSNLYATVLDLEQLHMWLEDTATVDTVVCFSAELLPISSRALPSFLFIRKPPLLAATLPQTLVPDNTIYIHYFSWWRYIFFCHLTDTSAKIKTLLTDAGQCFRSCWSAVKSPRKLFIYAR